MPLDVFGTGHVVSKNTKQSILTRSDISELAIFQLDWDMKKTPLAPPKYFALV